MKYGVFLPIAGTLYVEVEADDEESAIQLALAQPCDISTAEWETLEHICEGNVFYGQTNDAYAEEIEDA